MESIPIELDKTRHIKLTFNAISHYDQFCGDNLLQTIYTADYGVLKMRNIIWAGLIHEDDTLTMDGVGELIEIYWIGKGKTVRDLLQVIKAAVANSGLLPQKEGNGKEKKPPANP